MESLPGWQRGQFLDWKGGDKKTVCSALSAPQQFSVFNRRD